MKKSYAKMADLIDWAKKQPQDTPIDMINSCVVIGEETTCCLMANWALERAKKIPEVHKIVCGSCVISFLNTYGQEIHTIYFDTYISSVIQAKLWPEIHTMGDLLDVIAQKDACS